MRCAIMQPYFMPYIGYFQLINAVDTFIIYDNIKYTKKGWINRNRILSNGKSDYITVTLKKDSDFLNINQRYLSNTWENDKKKIINKLIESYKKSPNFDAVSDLILEIFNSDLDNLFEFIFYSIVTICDFLEIKTNIIKSSDIDFNLELKSDKKVIAICKSIESNKYYNPIGGLELYNKNDFAKENIELSFLKTNEITYKQYHNKFVPYLSIIDVLMFNKKNEIINLLEEYSII